MEDSLELIVVSYFGKRPDHVQNLVLGSGVAVRHVSGLQSLKSELNRRRPEIVLVDRWLLNDEAAACVLLARTVHDIPTLLMASALEIQAGCLDFPETVDGVLEKPLRAEALLTILDEIRSIRPRTGSNGGGGEAGAKGPIPAAGAPSGSGTVRPAPVEPEPARPGADEPGEPDLSNGAAPAAASPPAARPVETDGDTESESEGEAPAEHGGVDADVEPADLDPGRGPGAARLLDDVRETLRRLGEVIRIDTMSGLLYRDFFVERVAREVKRASRYAQPLAAIMIDIDSFKSINDEHGHAKGNEVLAALGSLIRGTIRRDLDVASRLYGDEFCIVLPATTADGAQILAQRIKRMITEDPSPLPFTVSMGVHCLSGRELDEGGVKNLLEGADQAMLAAKRAGRDGVRIHDGAVQTGVSEPSRGPEETGESRGDAPRPASTPGDDREPHDAGGSSEAPSFEDGSFEDGSLEDTSWDETAVDSIAFPRPEAAPPLPEEVAPPGAPEESEAPHLGSADEDTSGSMERPGPTPPAITGSGADDERADGDSPSRPGSIEEDADASAESTQLEEDPLATALADAVGALAGEDELKRSEDYRGKALLVSGERDVAEILVDFLGGRGIPVEIAPDFPTALTLLDSLEFFLVLADARPEAAETKAFCRAAERIDRNLYVFLFVSGGDQQPDPPAPGNTTYVRKPFLLSDLYLQASRAREDYHLRHIRDEAG
jgi:diguanylate cyclase (GGDEF)-like protein